MQKISIVFLLVIGFVLGKSTSVFSQNAIISIPTVVPTIICSGNTIIFTADDNGGTIVSYQWNFNGGANGPQTLYGQTVTFTAGVAKGTPYNFELIVNDGMSTNTLNFQMTVSACKPPDIDISADKEAICAGMRTVFTDLTIPGADPILTGRMWIFPGGNPVTSNAANVSITYANAGVYDVYYEVKDLNGTYTDTLKNYMTVLDCAGPIADFSANVTRICPGDCINFTDDSKNMTVGKMSWLWSFSGSDSLTSVQQNPVNICYQTPGLYTVKLTSTNTIGSGTELKVNYIQVGSCSPPVSSFKVEKQKICEGTCIKYTNTSRRSDNLSWKFSGVDPVYQFSSVNEPIVCYSMSGEYNVELTSTNPYGTHTITESDYISVKEFPQVQAPADVSVLIGQSVVLQAYGTGQNFNWAPDDGSIDCVSCSKVVLSPLENTKYFITNINENGVQVPIR